MLLQWKIRNGKRASVRLLRDVMDSVKPDLNLDEVYNVMYSDSEPSSLEESEESEGNETDVEDSDSGEDSELCASPVAKSGKSARQSGKSVKFQKESGKSMKSGKLFRKSGKPAIAGKP